MNKKNSAVDTVVDFMAYAIHKLDTTEDFTKLKGNLSKKIGDLGIKEDDLKRYDIAFMLIDTSLTNRNYDESEQMFMNIVLMAGNKFGKPGVWSIKEFMKEKIKEAKEQSFAEWRILEEFLCESPFAKASSSTEGVTHMLTSYVPAVVQEKTKVLLDLNFDNVKIEIVNNLIEIKNIEDETT